jgi:hypothetical protein
VVRSYLRFNVSGLAGSVVSATLRIWANTSQTTGYDAYSVADNTWGETTITSANAPPFGTTKLGLSGKIAAGTWTSVNVTSAIAGNGTYSFGLSTTNSTAVSLSSREGLYPPQLVMVWSGSGSGSQPTNAPTNPPTAAPSPTPTAAPTATPSPTPTAAPTTAPSSTPSSAASETRYPGSATVTPVADSYVSASTPTSNFGTLTQVRIDGSPVARTFLRFTVTGVTGTVNSAVLRVYANTAQTTGYDLYPVASTTWGETTIADANAPPFGATKLGSSGKIAAGTWTSVDLTSAISGNGTYSFGLSTTNSTAVSLSSREGANPPQLVISWTNGASLVVPLSPSRPDPRLVVLGLAIPLLACGVLLLERRRVSRALSGSLVRPSEPAAFALAHRSRRRASDVNLEVRLAG